MIDFTTIITIALMAIITGASNAFGIWLVSKHLIKRLENEKKEVKLDK